MSTNETQPTTSSKKATVSNTPTKSSQTATPVMGKGNTSERTPR